MMSPSPTNALTKRQRTQGSAPLWTLYDRDGSRVELSARTVANWVDKIAWFLDDEGMCGEPVQLAIAEERPLHWMTLVWVLGCWQAGCTPTATAAALAVCSLTQAPTCSADTVVACSLTPFGMPIAGLEARYIDFADLRTQPDEHYVSPSEVGPWWCDDRGTMTQLPAPDAARRIITSHDIWISIRDGVLAPLLGGGSVVFVESGDARAIAAAEHATL